MGHRPSGRSFSSSFSGTKSMEPGEVPPYFGRLDAAARPATAVPGAWDKRLRPRNAMPSNVIQELAQMPKPKFVVLATAAMAGAPIATPTTRSA